MELLCRNHRIVLDFEVVQLGLFEMFEGIADCNTVCPHSCI